MLFTCFVFGKTQSQSVNHSTLGEGLQFVMADSSFSLALGVRFQMLYQGGVTPSTHLWDDRFLIRRSRLKFDGFVYSPRLEYKIELGLSNRDIGGDLIGQTNNADNIILDAVAKWRATPNLALWIGQTKLPGNRERVISSQKMQFVDRSLLNAQFTLDRDAGLQLHHEHKVGQAVLREIGSISMGEGRNITAENGGGYAYTVRLEVLPFGLFESGGDYSGSDLAREETPKLSLAASFDYNDNASRSRGQLGSFLSEERDLQTVFMDAMFKFSGFSAMAEYANRRAPDGPVVGEYANGSIQEELFITGSAFNIQTGYLFKNNWEVAGRYTTYNPTEVAGASAQAQYTIGLSKYIAGHSLKVQSDLTLQQEENAQNRTLFRLQMEVAL